MADPWTEDFAALNARARHQMRSITATRASILARSASKEPRMRLVKHHPILAALAAILFLAVPAPLAYAVVDPEFVSVDPLASTPIELSV